MSVNFSRTKKSCVLSCEFFVSHSLLKYLAAMSELTKSMCWELVKISRDDLNEVGAAIYRKPSSNECYEKRSQNEPPLCNKADEPDAVWYIILHACDLVLFHAVTGYFIALLITSLLLFI